MTVGGGKRFAESGCRGQKEEGSNSGQDNEHAAPGGDAKELCADDRGEDGREAIDEHEQREIAGGGDASVPVTHDGPCNDDTRRARETLDEPQHNKGAAGWCEDAQERRNRIGCHTNQEGATAA